MAFALNVSAAVLVINQTTDPTLDTTFLDYGMSHYDTTTNLEWLDFGNLVTDKNDAITLGYSINYAESWYGAQGWRLASETEVTNLFSTFFEPEFDGGTNGKMTTTYEAAGDSFLQARNSWLMSFGTDASATVDNEITTVNGILSSRGMYVDDDGSIQYAGILLGLDEDANLRTSYYSTDFQTGLDLTRDSAYTNFGVFMVRSSRYIPPPVPIPAAIWLFGSGLIGLFFASRRKLN